jgi:hypothetical protein
MPTAKLYEYVEDLPNPEDWYVDKDMSVTENGIVFMVNEKTKEGAFVMMKSGFDRVLDKIEEE